MRQTYILMYTKGTQEFSFAFCGRLIFLFYHLIALLSCEGFYLDCMAYRLFAGYE